MSSILPGEEALESASSPVFREAMSRVASAVHIITTGGPGGPAGFTATAAVSVSDEPPTLLVCLNHRSRLVPAFRENGRFCVNTLSGSQEGLADVFAGRTGLFGEARFQEGRWLDGAGGVPVLADALTACECVILEMRHVATHDLMLGRVIKVHLGEAPAGLAYRGRVYHRV